MSHGLDATSASSSSRPSGWEGIETALVTNTSEPPESSSRPSGWEGIETALMSRWLAFASGSSRPSGWEGIETDRFHVFNKMYPSSSRPSGWEGIETMIESDILRWFCVAPGLRAGRGLKRQTSFANLCSPV